MHQKINVELMKNIIIRVKYQESRTGCENLAYFQSIESKCKLNITKIYLGKRQIRSISKLALLPWLQIYHDNKENRRISSDSLTDVYTVTLMASITCWLYKNYVGKVSPFYPD